MYKTSSIFMKLTGIRVTDSPRSIGPQYKVVTHSRSRKGFPMQKEYRQPDLRSARKFLARTKAKFAQIIRADGKVLDEKGDKGSV